MLHSMNTIEINTFLFLTSTAFLDGAGVPLNPSPYLCPRSYQLDPTTALRAANGVDGKPSENGGRAVVGAARSNWVTQFSVFK